jgi:tRNA dimethylallyltransferase
VGTSKNIELTIITGCTAVGKTNYAVLFAKKNNSEIISCDSLLVYKHMNIGTAKPTEREMDGVKHHCINLVEPSEKFDVSKFIDCAKIAIDAITSAEKNVVIVGGSGFYLKSLYSPVIDCVKIPANIEFLVNETYKFAGLDGVVAALISANNGVCPSIDVKNPRRVVAALKRCLAAGKTFDDLQAEFCSIDSPFSGYRKRTILLCREKRDLEIRVRERVKKMIDAGLIAEVEFLLSNYENLTESAKNAIGYRETINWLKNSESQLALIDKITANTLKLIKKQKTWLKKYIPFDEKFFLTSNFLNCTAET